MLSGISVLYGKKPQSYVRKAFEKALRKSVKGFEDFNKNCAIDEIVSDKLVKLGRELQLDPNEEEIHQFISAKAEELTSEDQIELEEKRRKEVETEKIISGGTGKSRAKKLAEAFGTTSSSVQILEEIDDNCERFAKANRQIQDALACYREICKQMKKSVQTKLDPFLKQAAAGRPSVITEYLLPATTESRRKRSSWGSRSIVTIFLQIQLSMLNGSVSYRFHVSFPDPGADEWFSSGL
ncbi:hypothetical protein M514_25767 [Trichuris suis]|uniref:Uncharacterized protein n=1 Tax=Trichuris suis TaxID=68888 RepID=A0A085MXV2_9BILA|nr:hypothetical protein M514_25767 [Trichuris suis]